MAVYCAVAHRYVAQWKWTERIPLPTGGAYRGSWLRVDRAGTPPIVRVASFVSLMLFAPALLSLPIMALGISVELEPNGPGTGETGPAILLGPTGFALSVAIFVAGIQELGAELAPLRKPSGSSVPGA